MTHASIFPSTDPNLERFGLDGQSVVRLQIQDSSLCPDIELMHDVCKEQVHLHINQWLPQAPPLPQAKGDKVLRDGQSTTGI